MKPEPSREEEPLDERSVIMHMVFRPDDHPDTHKMGFCAALYLTLALIWAPSFQFGSRVHTVSNEQGEIKRRVVLRPPAERPLEQVRVKQKQARKVPMPDTTPLEPEPVFEDLEPLPEPELIAMEDDWDIGVPDAPPAPVGEAVARVGDEGLEPPVFTRRVVPKYPSAAVQIKLQGYVALEAILRRDGSIDDIKVLRSLAGGKFGFEREAMLALKQWEFVPGQLAGAPTDVRMIIKLDFILN